MLSAVYGVLPAAVRGWRASRALGRIRRCIAPAPPCSSASRWRSCSRPRPPDPGPRRARATPPCSAGWSGSSRRRAGLRARSRRSTATAARPCCAPAAPTSSAAARREATRPHAHRQHRQGVQRRRRAAPRRGTGKLGLDDTIGAAAARPAGGLGGGDAAPAAQPHQRPARLHAVRRPSPSRRRTTRAATSRRPRSSTGCAADPLGVRAGLEVRVLEHRQHRRRADRRGGRRQAVPRRCSRRSSSAPRGLAQTTLPDAPDRAARARSSTATSSSPGASPRT